MRMLLCFQLTQNVHFNWNMYDFKFNYLSCGQFVSLNLDKILLPLLKMNFALMFAIVARMLCRNHLNSLFVCPNG